VKTSGEIEMAARNQARRAATVAEDDRSDLEDLVGYNLKRAYVVIQNDFRKALGKDGLGPRVFSALSYVVQFPNITQSELARKLGIERSGLVAIIDELEERSYLNRTTVPNDRRVQALVPTISGINAYDAAFSAVSAHEAHLLGDMSEGETAQLIELLKKIRFKEAAS
jgi:DNA-binding MarR family transcriptional regulator